MPPLDWGRIIGADLEALREDLDAADDMYSILEMVNYKRFAWLLPYGSLKVDVIFF